MQKSVGIPVMDVPVLLSDKFLQSKEFDQNAPQIQFIFRVWDNLIVQRRRVRTVQPVKKTGDSLYLCSSWGLLDMARRCATTGAGMQPVQAALKFHRCRPLAVGAAAWEEEGGGSCFQTGSRSSSHR